jgi:CheY-like chemotaxis protein
MMFATRDRIRYLAALVASLLPIGTLCAKDAADDFGDKPAARNEERKLRPSSDPAVKALLATRPTTPEELLKAVEVLIDLRALDDAYALLKQLEKAKPDDEAWANLVEKLGSAVFLRLALIDELQPDGREISDAALAAAEHRARDPGRIAKLIDQLSDPSPAVRRGAMTRLLWGRETAIQALAAALIDPARKDSLSQIRAAVARFGRVALPPLTAMVRSSHEVAQVEAIHALAELGQSQAALEVFAPALLDSVPPEVRSAAQDALVKLIGRVPQSDEVVDTLLRKARSAFAESLQEPDPDSSPVTQWRWESESSTLEYALVQPLVGHLDHAADWSADAARLAPRRREALWLSLAARVEADAFRGGAEKPAPNAPASAVELLKAEDVEVVDAVLGFALSGGHTVAATAAARVLGEIATPDILYRLQPQPGSLVEAARSGDRRLRFAALEAIVRLKPKRPYPGSSLVVEAMGYLAGTFAAPRVMSADARTAEAERQAGLLADLGYEVEMATNERDVVAEIISSPDYVFALIDYSLAAPTSGQLLQRLRRDNRTARLPIGIIASSDDLDRARRLSQKTPLSAVIFRPVDTAGLDLQLQRLLAQAGERLVAPEERLQQARQAVDWLVEISSAPPRIYNIYNLGRVEGSLTAAVQVGELSLAAAKVLGTLGTATSQRTLIDLASQPAQSMEIRRAAGKAFADSVAQFGTLLTTGEISRQYDRYNQSLRGDEASQALLASILDTIEARSVADQPDE